MLGFALTIPSFVTWIPETLGTILMLTGIMTQEQWVSIIEQPGFWRRFAQLYQFVALGWYLALFSVAAAVVQRVRWWKAIVIGVITLIVTGLWMLRFLR